MGLQLAIEPLCYADGPSPSAIGGDRDFRGMPDDATADPMSQIPLELGARSATRRSVE
jgi:hypothetical protein